MRSGYYNFRFLGSCKRAFSLMEVIIVVVIIGVLAAIALPRFSDTVEKSRISEGINVLDSLRNSQVAYYLEYTAYTNSLANLDMTIPVLRNFLVPTVATVNPIASIERNVGGIRYTLTIDLDGAVKCGGTLSPANICNKIGCNGAGNQCN